MLLYLIVVRTKYGSTMGSVTALDAARAFALGASAVWVGTRFLASREARIHDAYREAVLSAKDGDTVRTTLFDGGWPDAPHRVIRNVTVSQWEKANTPSSPTRPGEGEEVARFADGRSIARYDDAIPLPGMTGDITALAMYAGEGVGRVTRVESAADIVRDLAVKP